MVIAAGVWLARLRERWPPRFSMETALLAMVVAAVVWAVLASADELDFYEWIWCLKVGFCTGLIALACVELVFGRRGLWRRVWLFVLCLLVSLVVFFLLEAITLASSESGFDWEYIKKLVAENVPIVLVGIAFILAALLLARESRWFHAPPPPPPTDAAPLPRWRLLGARVVLTTIMLAVLTPCAYVFVELMTPTPFPPIVLPEPNGYDDIVAAGRMVRPQDIRSAYQVNLTRPSAIQNQIGDLVLESEAAYELLDRGLSRSVACPYLSPWDDQAHNDWNHINTAMLPSIRTTGSITEENGVWVRTTRIVSIVETRRRTRHKSGSVPNSQPLRECGGRTSWLEGAPLQH